MKKKIFLVLAVMAMLICIFAISVSAAEIPEWTEITKIDGMTDKANFGTDGTIGATSRVLMSDGVTYPAYYICKDSDTLGISFNELNSKTSKSYAAKDVERIELPSGIVTVTDALKVANGYTSLVTVVIPEGATTINSYAFKSKDAGTNSPIVSVTIPSTVNSIGLQAFAYCNSLKELIIPEGITEIPEEMARNTTSLTSLTLPSTIKSIGKMAFRTANLSNGVVIPEGCTEIGNYAFKGSSAKSVTLPSTLETLGTEIFCECHQLTDVYSKSTVIAEKMFYDCDELIKVTLENTIEIGNSAFCNPNGGILKINSIVLPEGLTTIGNYAFIRSQITSLVLPSTLTTIGQNAFQTSTSLKKVVALNSCFGASMFQDCSAMTELVLTENFVTLGSSALANVSQESFTTYYTGTDYDRIKSVCSGTTRLSNAKYYSYADYENKNYTYNKFMVIYGVNLCVAAFNGEHTEPQDDGNCTTAVICSVCADYTYKEAMEHVSNERITYLSFAKDGEYYVGCTNDGCTFGTIEKLDALFTCLGYSAPEDGRGGIAIGFTVNNEAIAKYEEITGKTLKYGVFAVLKDSLGTNDVFADDGTVAEGVINAEITNYEFAAFELKIVGFTDTQKDTKLAMGAYVAETDGETTEYSYMQGGEPNENEKYCFVSYNDIVGKPSTNEEVTQ